MGNKNLVFYTVGEAELESAKLRLGSMRGIISMDIDSKTNNISVDYDEIYVNEKQITRCLNEIGYQRAK